MNFEIIQKMVEVSSAPQFDPGLGQLAWTAKGNGRDYGTFLRLFGGSFPGVFYFGFPCNGYFSWAICPGHAFAS